MIAQEVIVHYPSLAQQVNQHQKIRKYFNMNYIIKFLYSCIFIGFTFSLDSDIKVSGNVYRETGNIPLEGANVLFTNSKNKTFGASTDKFGAFVITNLKPDLYSITISYIGFQDYKKDIDLKSGQQYTVNATLSVESILMTKLEIISNVESDYQRLPGSASIINERSFKLINPIGTQEILEHVPGINAFSDDGIGNSRISIGIRGLNPRRSSRVLILEDGVPIQPALYVYPNMYYNPPAERINRVEVIKGSGSISFGPQTMGGVINYLTKRPQGDDNKLMKFSFGENGYKSFFIETGNWIKSDFNPEIQLLLKQGDGFRENNHFDQINTTIKFNYTASKNRTFYSKTNFNYENSNATYTGLTQWSYENDPNFNPKEHDSFEIKRFSTDLIFTERINSSTVKTSKAFLSYFDRRWWREDDKFIYASDIGMLDTMNASDIPTQQFGNYFLNDLVRIGNGESNFGILRTFYVVGLEQIYNKEHLFLGKNTKTEMGTRIYFERFIDDRVIGDSPDSRQGIFYIPAIDEESSPTIVGQSHHYQSTAFSSFISQSIKMGNLMIRPGLRFEIFEQERIDLLNGATYLDKTSYVLLPGIGFTKDISNFNVKVFGGIHRGFTPPSSGALKILNFGDTPDGLDLKSEKSWNKEIGFRSNVSMLDIECALFHIDIEDMVAAGRGTAFQNLGKVSSMGLEASGILKVTNKNSIHFSYTYLDAKVKDGKVTKPTQIPIDNDIIVEYGQIDINGFALPYSPKHTLVAGFESRMIEGFALRLDYKYVSKVYSDFLNLEESNPLGISGPIPGYGILNLSANYNVSSNLKVTFSAKNLMDLKYIGSRLHSSPYQAEAGLSSGIIPGARRQINFSLEYLF